MGQPGPWLKGKGHRTQPLLAYQFSPAWFCSHITQTPSPADFLTLPTESPGRRCTCRRGQRYLLFLLLLVLFLSAQPSSETCPCVQLLSAFLHSQVAQLLYTRSSSPGDQSWLLGPCHPSLHQVSSAPALRVISNNFQGASLRILFVFSVLYNQTLILAFLG